MNVCHACESTDVIGPFEMDGISDGEYHARGLWWLVCRVCHKSTVVPRPSL